MPNIFAPESTERTDPGLVGRLSRVGAQAGSQRLGATVYEIAPGAVSSPFHAHHANEELINVLAGAPMLRTPEAERSLAAGEVVSRPAAGRGAHQLRNETSEPCA